MKRPGSVEADRSREPVALEMAAQTIACMSSLYCSPIATTTKAKGASNKIVQKYYKGLDKSITRPLQIAKQQSAAFLKQPEPLGAFSDWGRLYQ